MKISFLAPHLKVSGGVRIILEYASRLAYAGHDVTVCVRSANPIRRTVANLFGLGYPKWVANFGARVLRVADFTAEHIPASDVLVATTYQTALAIAEYPKEKGRQCYLLQHDEGLYHGDRALSDRAYRLPQEKIVVATWLKELLKDKYGQEAALLLNPIDRKLFRPVPRDLRDGVRILILDHTYDWKGTKEGVAIVAELKKKYPEIRLVGFGARKPQSEHRYDEYHYNLPQEKLAWLYSNCDIFLCPSWDEGFGLPSIEAMACKVAVATYDNGGSRDFAFHEKTALVAPRRDTKRLAVELERLVRDPALRERIAEGGYKHVLTMPTWEEQTKQLEKILVGEKQ